ncbi:MAG TPA: inositol monophosphatase family protein [Chromatiales bacterium]|nr:inositol monophosphatase family protein [Chromatiales bacterium]
MPDLNTLQALVTTAAHEELLPRFAHVERQQKADGSLLTEADLAMQSRLLTELANHWPDIALLGEEMPAEEQRRLLQSGQAVWCLDPLDGTRNFAAGIPYFSVSLALLQDRQVVLGLVVDPVRNEVFTARAGQGAHLNGQSLALRETGLTLAETTAIVDFKRLDPALSARLVTDTPYASQRSFGSVALDWCWLAAGRGHLYLHGKQNIWDYAAGQLVFQEAGGHAATLEGEEIFRNERKPRAVAAAVDQPLFASWARWLGISM